MRTQGAGWHALSRAREHSAASKMSSMRSTRTSCQRGMRSGMPVPGAALCNGSLITRSSTTTMQSVSCPGTQIPP
jgi:hypothetical protein